MNIGIVGLGVVGEAVKRGLESIGHTVHGHDIRLGTSIDDVLKTDLCFLCVPTPCDEQGSCDTSIVETVVRDLETRAYPGVVVIKSTVTPGTTDRLAKQHPTLRFVMCSEFLRERSAYEDFVNNHDVCVIGAYDDATYELVKRAHGSLPANFAQLTPTEAEFAKYFSNVYNALRIVFANGFYDTCRALGADYTKVKNAMVLRDTIDDHYLDCREDMRGFGGMCLPKDTSAFAALVKQLGLESTLFDAILEDNKKLKKNVFPGMRE
jgi:UDPglucose 6-dehydrogenase